MSDTLGLAVVAAAAGIIGPGVMAFINWWVSAKKQKLDYARQDAVAQQVKEAKAATQIVAQTLAESTRGTNGKLDHITELVNSKMTESMDNQLDAEKKGLALMKEVMALKEAAGLDPSQEASGIIKATEGRIAELQARVNDRKHQQEAIDKKKVP